MRLLRAQREGKSAQDAADFLRGFPIATGTALDLMPRYRLTIEYDGRPYRGFQAQASLPSVQGAIETAVLGFTGETNSGIHAAGRTDTGVHATGQVIHVDLDEGLAR